MEGERKLVTVFFADVANFTAMSEKLDPEEVHAIMDGCFKILMDEITDVPLVISSGSRLMLSACTNTSSV
jgi:hypothetical protein